ncbi:restriction endonuclease subunit S [Enterovibrio coralii]|uniref:Type I restriction endonuclease subunit S n=1 Tax=Enterovibrio coralii TaxID=294935 RepID=A0A135I2R8_9GAMM|nr:restriction endonuclease subunit S [Enterovibrio coralii]KXF79732.1 type I restriction endonuclease subunit S [Enterovibrio coralii]
MRGMEFIDKLLDGIEIEWKTLKEIAIIGTGSSNTNEALENGKYPFFVRSQTPRTINEYEFDETAIITAGDGVGVGKVFHYVKGKYALHQRAYRIVVNNDTVDSKFLYHFIKTNFAKYLEKTSVHASVTSLRKPMFEKYLVPIPCPNNPEKSLEIQAEIVRVLDSFSEKTKALTSELTTELNLRKKQYDHYRDQLFDTKDNRSNLQLLGNPKLGKFVRGGGLQKKDFTDNGVGCIHYGQIFTHYDTAATATKSFVSKEFALKAKMASEGDLIIATTSENDKDVCKAVAWLGSDDIAISSDACIYKHSMNPKYVSYYFQTEHFDKQKRKYITGTKVKRVNADNLAKIQIPVLSSDEQENVVNFLDELENKNNLIINSLTKEIKLRQQQYEYYREQLLSFKKQDETIVNE